MDKEQVLQEKLDELLESINKVHSILSNNEERLIAIERLVKKIDLKLSSRKNALELLELVKRKNHHNKIKPTHLQSKQYREGTKRAMQEEDDDE